jgi:putative ATP-binding cassette transporter
MRPFLLLLFSALALISCHRKLPSVMLTGERLLHAVDSEATDAITRGKIPGLSVVIIRHDTEIVRSYGFADVAARRYVSRNTEFQLGSCSKAFTALAMLKLAADRKIDLDTPVISYLPWFLPLYEDTVTHITIRQLLHHTSGIPWQTISLIPPLAGKEALETTVRKVAGITLRKQPGKEYEYATINYDILALLIQHITGNTFERYMQDSIFRPLGLSATTIGVPADSSRLATGYKIGFFKARRYDAPVFRGNNAAGYVISDAADVARWLDFQLGKIPGPLFALAQQTHERDETVPPQGVYSYAMGWQVSLSGNGELLHTGLNPNYSTFIAMQPKKGAAVAVLANSNSNYCFFLGDRIMKAMMGEEIKNATDPDSGSDTAFSIIGLVLGCYFLIAAGVFVSRLVGLMAGTRKYEPVTPKKAWGLFVTTLFVAPVGYAVWLAPAIMGFNWQAVVVWAPVSFVTVALLLVLSLVISYLTYWLSILFPGTRHLKKELPAIILVSIISGLSNMGVILLITSSLGTTVRLGFLTFYFLIILMIYIACRRYVQMSLIRLTRNIVYDIRVKLIDRIFSNSYRQFEKIDKGNIYATLEYDVRTVGDAAGTIVGLVTSLISVAGAFLYLATLTFWTTMVTLGLIIIVSAIYTAGVSSTKRFLEEARDTQNVFMRLINGMIEGFKEISLHRNKRMEYKEDFSRATAEYRDKTYIAGVKLINANVLGESCLISILGAIAFAVPKLWPDTELYIITSFIVILLYLNGPMNTILTSIPAVIQLRVAWSRIDLFMKLIPAGEVAISSDTPVYSKTVESLKIEGLCFSYANGTDNHHFSIGPVDLEVEKGQVIFIIGGNGSGKTTLAKLIVGLYEPDNGKTYVDGKEMRGAALSEYYSVVFSPCYLFEKLYNIETAGRLPEIKKYLQLLGLEDKVEIRHDRFSTINLSGGQRKRLALLLCLLENRPIYLFDEWAADQDPEYRRFFYREILPSMRRNGKIVIAITHDDHYFDVADKILKMDMGRGEYVDNNFKVDEVLAG